MAHFKKNSRPLNVESIPLTKFDPSLMLTIFTCF